MVFRCLISRVSVSNPYSKVGKTVAWKILVLGDGAHKRPCE